MPFKYLSETLSTFVVLIKICALKYTRKRSQEMQPLLGSKSTYIVFLLEVNMYGSDAKIIFFLLMYDVNIYDNLTFHSEKNIHV